MMDEKNLDLTTVNEVDMECHVMDDDDTFCLKPSSAHIASDTEGIVMGEDDRPIEHMTGIILDLSDDDLDRKPMRTISTNLIDAGGISIDKNYHSDFNDFGNPEDINAIDMECSIGEDDDFRCIADPKDRTPFGNDEDYCEHHETGDSYHSHKSYDDYMDELRFSNKEFVDEDMLREKKKLTQGEVEKDYWKKLQKKHAASNKKGAYNTSFHFAGNPKLEMDMFNHDMTPAEIPSMPGGLVGGDVTGSATGEASVSAGSGEGCCESLNADLNKGLNDILLIIGFEVIKNSDGSYTLLDNCNPEQDCTCASKAEVLDNLQPYIDDCFILPLQLQTNQKFNSCKEFCDWYTPEMEKQYPQCKNDIRYCDILANHWDECDF